MGLIQVEAVTKSYETPHGITHALRGVDLTVERGDFVAVMGPSGSGKSTLLSMVGLLSTPTKGRIVIDGQETQSMTERARTGFRSEKLGFVFQFPSLVNTLNVRENVLLPKMLVGPTRRGDLERADELLRQVGLAGRGGDRSYQLSGGEQRRVALARALMNEPLLLLADEPTGALDEETALEMMELLHSIREKGTTVMMVTHDKSLSRYANRLVTIRDGAME